MPLLLTILSVLAVWTLLSVLVVGLLLIFKVLDSIRGRLQRVTAGVRAIERQAAPFEGWARRLPEKLDGAAGGLAGAAERLADVDGDLDGVAAALGDRR